MTDKFEHELKADTSRPFGMSTSKASIEAWFLREVLPLEAVLTSYFARHWANRADIRDMMQDVYVRVCEAAYRDIPHPARPFVFTVARNVLIDKFRDRPVVPLETVGDLESLSTTDQATPERTVIARDELRKLQTALDKLSPRHREALLLQKVEGLSRREIAQRMGVSEETVKTHLAAGLFALSDLYLNGDAEEFLMGSDNKAIEETASDIQALASCWVVERHGASTWSDDDQARLDSWLNVSVAHSVAYWRASHVWNRADRLVALKRPPEQDIRKEKRGVRSSTLWAVATMAVLAFVGAVVSLNAFRTNYVTYSTAIGEHRALALADGSRIELNTDSVLRLAKGESRSEAILDRGEAYFDIKHNADNPFTVVAHGRNIVDVGTKFLVRENSDALKVSMLEGRVALSAPAQNEGTPTELKAGDVAIATASATKVVRSSVQALADTAQWRNGYLTFRHVTLADAVAEFNRYNNAKLNVEGAGVSSKKIYGTFRTTDVKLFASVAQDVLHLHVERRGDEIVLSR